MNISHALQSSYHNNNNYLHQIKKEKKKMNQMEDFSHIIIRKGKVFDCKLMQTVRIKSVPCGNWNLSSVKQKQCIAL